MNILALDPGPEKTGWVLYDGGEPVKWGCDPNHAVLALRFYKDYQSPHVAIEEVVSYGLGFDKHLRDTIAWAATFAYAYGGAEAVSASTGRVTWVPRAAVKRHFGVAQGQNVDSSVRKAIIDHYGGRKAIAPPAKCSACHGRGKTGRGNARTTCDTCSGTGKGAPAGLLHGITGDVWSALAVAITASAQKGGQHG